MRALIRLVLFLLVLAVIAYTAVWFYAAAEVKKRLGDFANDSRGSEQSLQFDMVNVSGFPLGFTVDLVNASALDAGRGVAWTGPEETGVSWSVFKPFTVSAQMSGKHLLRPAGTSSGQIPLDIKIESREIALTGGLDQRLKAVSIDMAKVSVANDLFGQVMFDNVKFRIDPPAGQGSPFRASVDKIGLPAPLSQIGTFTDGSARGFIEPNLPKTHKRRHMKAWQQSGGKFIIEEYKGNVDGFHLDGTGSLQLDADLQPNLELTTFANGLDGLIKQAVSLGFIGKKQENTVRFGALMFEKPARSGSGKELVLPLNIESGWVVFGPMKLKKLPQINWPR